uniref:Maturase K n=1 Tax=Schistochila macrodonta TaxID=2575589 RepID=A0A4Y5P5M4_9MARC|nr:maturase K [Schistochila macrodonta]QCW58562.1 maturase K [Schistochila macrodonta]
MRELKKIKRNSLWQHRFLYPLFFQDDFYGIAYNRFFIEFGYRKNKNYCFNNEFNFLTVKRFIKKSRQSQFLWIVSDQFINKFQIIQEILVIFFNFIFTIQSESFTENTNEWNSNQSVHSIFSFMENKIYNSTICLDITIPYSFHPEILIRTFRRDITDISFIHFLRLLIHQNEIIVGLNPHFYLKKSQFYNLLWNFHIRKFEYSLLYIWKQIYNFQSILFWFFINKTNFVQKIKNISKQLDFVTMQNIIQKNYSFNYVRYQNNLVVATNGNFNLFIQNWNIYFFSSWEKFFHLWLEPHRIFVKDLSENPVCFLGYVFYTKSKSTVIENKFVNDSINTNLITKEFCSIIPIVPLIRLLAKERFCDTFGRPICRLSWTTLTDHEIFRRFDEIVKNLFCYYSGCIKKKGLYQLQYILRFSCAKTLACKHKSTIRTVWKKYGSNFLTNSVFLKKTQLTSWRTYEKKIWYFNIIQINYLANFSQKLKNVNRERIHRDK